MHLIVGADSMVGRALTGRLLAGGERVAATTRRAEMVGPTRLFLDLAHADPHQRWPWPVDVAYVCAGVPNLEACRSDPVGTAHINVTGVMATVTRLVAQGAFVVYLSSNLVFDGSLHCRRADDPPCPRTEYGRQKAEVERHLSAFGTQVAVVRFTKIVGRDTPLLRAWIEAIRNRREIRPLADMVMAPVPVSFAVAALERVAQVRLPGIVQVSADQDVTYEQIARYLTERLGGAPEMIRPSSCRATVGLREPVPTYTSLDTARLRNELGMNPPDVWQAFEDLLAETSV
jgi:dTDP-4-dehydrorhamnose reductase